MKEGEKKVIIVDPGGRGHSAVDKHAESESVGEILVVPGNDLCGFNTEKPVRTFPEYKTTSVIDILNLAEKEHVDLVEVLQDDAIEIGLVDVLEEEGIPVVGPTSDAGKIEWDKAHARKSGKRYGLPQPEFHICRSPEEGINFIKAQDEDRKWFVKASGLAQGKGALPAKNNKEALERISEMARFEENGRTFLIEEWLEGDDGEPGEEFSAFILSDGKNYKMIGYAQDYKRLLDNDEGDMTGGMGSSTPVSLITHALSREIETTIFDRTMQGFSEEGLTYKGDLYLGGMIVKRNGVDSPWVIEFNARPGDPEAQIMFAGIEGDFYKIRRAVADGNIRNVDIKLDNKARVVVAGVSKGYPGNYENVRGKEIFGLLDAKKMEGIKIYGAAVKVVDGKHYVDGGRLFYIVGEGDNIVDAQERAYEAMKAVRIEDDGLFYRKDIGWREIQRLREAT